MLDQKDRGCLAQVVDQGLEVVDLAIGKALGWLIKDQQAGLLHEAHGGFQQPLVSIAEVACVLVLPVM